MNKQMEIWRVREISCDGRKIGRTWREHFYLDEKEALVALDEMIADSNRRNPKYLFETEIEVVDGVPGYCNWQFGIMVALHKGYASSQGDRGMTDAETAVMQYLVDFWNEYLMLGDSGTEEVKQAVHAIQGVLAIRVARRVNPEIWR